MADYCTLWPEGNWSHCCKAHDIAYELGTGKIAADLELITCVAQQSQIMGVVMGAGVLTFGWLFYYKRKTNGLTRRDKNTSRK